MVHRTPLRLIEGEEGAPAREDQEAAPVETVDENGAATRKVAVSGMIASEVILRSRWKRPHTWRMIVPAAAVVLLGALTVSLATRERTTVVVAQGPRSVSTVAVPPQETPPRALAPQPVVAPLPADAPKGAPAAGTVHISVRATPVEAELSLDGKVVAGHRLNLDVPRDGLAHVVSAWASGYVPFNQQVIFSGDVALDITLRRDHAATPQPAARPRPAPVVPAARRIAPTVKPPVTPVVVKPAVMPAPVQAPAQPRSNVEPGMNLDRPSVRSDAKSIDERNPYKP